MGTRGREGEKPRWEGGDRKGGGGRGRLVRVNEVDDGYQETHSDEEEDTDDKE